MCYVQKSYVADATLDECSELFLHREVIGPGSTNVTFATFEILPYSTNLLFNMGHFPKRCQISRFMAFVKNVRYLALWHFGCMKWVICN